MMTIPPHSAKWQTARIAELSPLTPMVNRVVFEPKEFRPYIAGQHIDIRLTAPDGYTAMRSYSIASSAISSPTLELAIERLPDGEVSTFFHDIAEVGDEIEIRGPLGGHFLWPQPAMDPVLMIGAGSGLVPLMAMIRQRRAWAQDVPTALLLSARTAQDVLFSQELHATEMSDPSFVLGLAITRETPARASDFARRIDSAMVTDMVARLPQKPEHVFVCGSNGFVNIATDGAVLAGLDPSIIKTERYGG